MVEHLRNRADLVAILVACAALFFMSAAEALHWPRVQRVAGLAFGPSRRPALWAMLTPFLRVIGVTAVSWGLVTLLLLPPKVHKIGEISESDYKNLLIVYDASPSMRLVDAGPTQQQSRRQRAADLLKSFFARTPIELYKISVIAVFTGAKPVVVGTSDMEVVQNILGDLPLQYAFKPGPTDLFSGLTEAAKIARPWRPRSTTVLVISDGDTIPATGTPKLPDSVAHVLVIGVGDTQAGRFIDGHQSRQDASTLRQLAARLGGNYHNGNEKQIGSALVKEATFFEGKSIVEKLTRREYAIMAVAAGSTILAALPILLWYFGTTWKPGTQVRRVHEKSANSLATAAPLGV
jgi:Ca-activated chloride channel family protein